jgi:hypothetical protein
MLSKNDKQEASTPLTDSSPSYKLVRVQFCNQAGGCPYFRLEAVFFQLSRLTESLIGSGPCSVDIEHATSSGSSRYDNAPTTGHAITGENTNVYARVDLAVFNRLLGESIMNCH